jgi:hypothetical protein
LSTEIDLTTCNQHNAAVEAPNALATKKTSHKITSNIANFEAKPKGNAAGNPEHIKPALI